MRYSPNGELYATAGTDGKIFLYNGVDGVAVGELGSPAHKGGIYAVWHLYPLPLPLVQSTVYMPASRSGQVSWSGDSAHLASASGDKSLKIWRVADRTLAVEIAMGSSVEAMQLGAVWLGRWLVSVELSGALNKVDTSALLTQAQASPGQPLRVEAAKAPLKAIRGHNKPLSAIASWHSPDGTRLVTAGNDLHVCMPSSYCPEHYHLNGFKRYCIALLSVQSCVLCRPLGPGDGELRLFGY